MCCTPVISNRKKVQQLSLVLIEITWYGCRDCFILIPSFLPLTNSLWGKYCCLPRVTEEETEAQRGEANCPRSQSLKQLMDGAPLYKLLQVGYPDLSKVEKFFKISENIPTVSKLLKIASVFPESNIHSPCHWVALAWAESPCGYPGPAPAQAQLGKAGGIGEWQVPWPPPPRPSSLHWEVGQLCHCCPLWCKAITVRRGDQEMACPILNSDQPGNTHCSSLEYPFGCIVRENDLLPRGKAAPGIQFLGCS